MLYFFVLWMSKDGWQSSLIVWSLIVLTKECSNSNWYVTLSVWIGTLFRKYIFFAKKELRKNKDIVRYLFQWIGTNFYWTLWQNLQSVMPIKTSIKNKLNSNSKQFDPFVSSNIWFLRIPIFNQIGVPFFLIKIHWYSFQPAVRSRISSDLE